MIYAIAALLSVAISQLLGNALGLEHGSPERIVLIVVTAAVTTGSALAIDLALDRRRRRQRDLETAAAREALRGQAADYDGNTIAS
ncbi:MULTISPECIES: hypothetical protein [Microbacterium]|uniref:Uncharacterized protein n=1 Tax=Microbacterium hominis TaxID=162426 RepID=A0A2K9DEU7_9MICO|nr:MULTISPECIES: hypothetical protein [Microbacterium]AUG29449.1 hypothetical protein CXR34_08215 [Microbacterium hominis]EPD84146.1 hypothetical protein HMPREF1529_02186 [Microbacterium sp. oral taxon 186 str. F0373]